MVGRLEDLALPDILQILGLSKRTGKLTLTRREGTGVILFREGAITYAASDSARETLGNILVCQRHITESTLLAALEIQHRSTDNPLLGQILVERGHLTQDVLERCVRQQIERVICEFFTWRQGFFKFELMDVQALDGVQVDTHDFLLKSGLGPEFLLPEAARRVDEGDPPHGKRAESSPAATPAPATPGKPPATTPGPAPSQEACGKNPSRNGSLSELRSILREIRAPNFTGEITLMILRYASKLLSRGVFFVLKSEGICGMGQFGLGAHGPQADERVRQIKIPADAPSVFAEVLEKRQTYLGPPRKTPWNDRLLRELGGAAPTIVVAVPMTVNETVVAILYGDNALDGRPIGELEGLELLMNQAGLAMEKALLEIKIKTLENRQAAPSPAS
jgi:hypothetical protein